MFPFFLGQGLAAKSRRTYPAGQRQFGQFIQTLAAVFPHGPTLQVSESQLVLFVSWWSGTSSPATVGTFYLAAVRSLHLHLGLFDPTQNAQCCRRVMKGIQRCGGSANSPRLQRASKILPAMFHSLSMTLSHDSFNIFGRRAVFPISDFFVPVSLRRRCRSTLLHISSWLMSRAYPSSPL